MWHFVLPTLGIAVGVFYTFLVLKNMKWENATLKDETGMISRSESTNKIASEDAAMEESRENRSSA
jgi:hypothetical protein